MDDRDQAVLAYRTALRHDCCCYEAFKHLTEHHLLTSADEQALISEIAFGGDDAWLELLYPVSYTHLTLPTIYSV